MTNKERLEKIVDVMGESASEKEFIFGMITVIAGYLADILDILEGEVEEHDQRHDDVDQDSEGKSS